MLQADNSPLVAGAQAPASQPTVRVRAVSQFRLPGRDDPLPGDVLELPRGLAAELGMYGRVQPVAADEPPATPKRKPKDSGHA